MTDTNLTRDDTNSHISVIWDALMAFREDCIPEGSDNHDQQWNDICTAMAWIVEDHPDLTDPVPA
jgi:hypothetical protein